ncbi:CsgG/HfaB family protein [Cohaesibacter celericrescens]|uniref:Curlin n=1 Tax=Cohaesibacter celericrescens TaxID=2067669 RepID=A0A2N5XSR9_9HYPH|nr:CsgG/HfaB family protein [Cohaesibacter celericrescens]PLW77549.1 curlin [Cohaesibacter celericrescens]
MLNIAYAQSANPRPKGRLIVLASSMLFLALGGCASHNTMFTEEPIVAKITPVNMKLRELPPPSKRIPVAVYEFQDQTGQYKEAKAYQQLSRAVTQGGAAILIKALQDAGNRQWFTVVERTRLPNLLKERQIITEMRRLYRGERQINPKVLPPLKHASVIIEGGIVGYNSNINTGGIGARYLGIGADTKYSKDEITVALRAVSTKTGEVLATVTARKSVVSVALQAGVFRFIKLDELLEGEAGVTNNEPRQLAVESAVEKAVEALIVEGIELGIWNFRDPKHGHEYVERQKSQQYGAVKARPKTVKMKPETQKATTISATLPSIFRKRVTKNTKPVVKSIKRLPPTYSNSEDPVG